MEKTPLVISRKMRGEFLCAQVGSASIRSGMRIYGGPDWPEEGVPWDDREELDRLWSCRTIILPTLPEPFVEEDIS